MERVRETCPEIKEQIEELLVVQNSRSQIQVQEDLYMKVAPVLEEIATTVGVKNPHQFLKISGS